METVRTTIGTAYRRIVMQATKRMRDDCGVVAQCDEMSETEMRC